jgi:hypothetical protein
MSGTQPDDHTAFALGQKSPSGRCPFPAKSRAARWFKLGQAEAPQRLEQEPPQPWNEPKPPAAAVTPSPVRRFLPKLPPLPVGPAFLRKFATAVQGNPRRAAFLALRGAVFAVCCFFALVAALNVYDVAAHDPARTNLPLFELAVLLGCIIGAFYTGPRLQFPSLPRLQPSGAIPGLWLVNAPARMVVMVVGSLGSIALFFAGVASGTVALGLLACVTMPGTIALNRYQLARCNALIEADNEAFFHEQTAHGTARVDSGLVLAAPDTAHHGFTIDLPGEGEKS